MKTMKKSRFLIFFGIALALVLSLCLFQISPSSVSFAEEQRQLVEINFFNSLDKIMNGSDEYSGNIYFNQSENKIENESGEELELLVSTTANSFSTWNIYNYADEVFEKIDSTTFGNNFSLKTLVQSIFGSSETFAKYVHEGKMTLQSEKDSALTTSLLVDSSVTEHGALYVSDVKIKNSIALNRGQEYNVKVVPNAYYQIGSVGIYKPYESSSYLNSETGTFFFEPAPVSSLTVKAVFEKIAYDVNFVASDRSHNALSDLETSNYLDVLTTTGKLSEGLGSIPTITSDNNFRFYRFEAYDAKNEQYDIINLTDEFVLNGAFIDKYAVEGQINVYVCFDELFEIEVLFNGNGSILGYVDGNLVEDSAYGQNSLTVYVSRFENVLVYLLPDEGKMLSNVSNVEDDELNGEILTLENVDADRQIVVSFDNKYYTIQVYSYLEDGRSINGYEQFTNIYVNDVKTNRIVANQTITKIETILDEDSDYKVIAYDFYRYSGNAWEGFSYNKTITSDYVCPGEDVLYVKVIYTRLYRATVYVDALSEGAGCFDVEILNADNTRQERYRNITEFNQHLESGKLVRVTAYPFAGYEFDSFTIKQTNLSDPEIITKSIENEDVSIGLVFKKVNVPIKIVSKSNHVDVDSLTDESVSIGEKITISYKIDFSYELKNIYINSVSADKLSNVSVEDGSIVIDVTKSFLGSLDEEGTISVNVQTKRDGTFVSFVIVIPIIIALFMAGAIVSVVVFVKTKRKFKKIEDSEIFKQ